MPPSRPLNAANRRSRQAAGSAADTLRNPASIFDLVQLRRDTATPLYQQLEQQLVDMIGRGEIAAGHALPAERQLATALGLSRATVQQCYGSLRARGLIAGHGRHGSIVQQGSGVLAPRMNRLKGFTEWAQELGKTSTTRVIERKVVSDRAVASLFALPSGSRFLKLVRLRLADDIPISLESAWYSLQAAPQLEAADGESSIYGHLAAAGMPLAYCEQTIDAISPSEEESEHFKMPHPMPCLMIKRRSYLAGDLMVEYVEGVFRGDLYSYKLRLGA